MIAKIKLIHDGVAKGIFKKQLEWNVTICNQSRFYSVPLQPQVGMTILIPEKNGNKKETFRFYVSHIVADVRNGQIVLIDRRSYGSYDYMLEPLTKLARRLTRWGWEEETS